jgi:hypothetical protein
VTGMQPLLLAAAVVVISVVEPVPSRSQPDNTLRGGSPLGFIVLPPLPPAGFYAWCETPRGLCVVQGRSPIAPRSTCSCGEYAGHTV